MVRRIRDRIRPRRGANAIEFALTLPLFLLIVLGLMDYGFLFSMQAGLDNVVALSCREGAMAEIGVNDPVAIATSEWNTRKGLVCNGGSCNFQAQVLDSGAYAFPDQALRCRGRRDMVSLTGFVPYPPNVTSVSYYRIEWQTAPPPVP